MEIAYLNNRICLNVLAGSLDNAIEIYQATEGHVLVGLLSANYPTIEAATEDMNRYAEKIYNCISIGLGAGNPNQWQMVGDLAAYVNAKHINQVFTGVGYTSAKLKDITTHINALVSPTGKPGFVSISTGPTSSKSAEAAIVPIETAIAMIKDMGGSAVKFFPMGGLKSRDELVAVAQACAKHDLVLEPTGGIDLENFEEIVQIGLDAGVKRIIPHVYSSIMDENKMTKVDDVVTLYDIMKRLTKG